MLQATYVPQPGVGEHDLMLVFFDPSLSQWGNAADANSDGGANAAGFVGAFSHILADHVGVFDDSLLSFHGVAPANHHVWALLDHNSTFGAGVAPEPGSLAVLALGGLIMTLRRRRA